MPNRDDYAMFAYGLRVNDEDTAYTLVEAYPEYNLEVQHTDDEYVVYVKGSDVSVGPRTGTLFETFPVSNSPLVPLTVEVNANPVPLSWFLVMWGPSQNISRYFS